MKRHIFKNWKVSKLSLYFLVTAFNLTFSFLVVCPALSQSLGISDGGTPPDVHALLDASSDNKGLLVPRMNTVQRDAIVSPANSLLIYNNTSLCLQMYDAATNKWLNISCTCSQPGSFSTTTATNIASLSFDANWSASSGATTYYLDVATDNSFTTFISGLNNLNVGNVPTYSVAGLTCETDYYYRVRAENACGFSSYSSTVATVTTANCCDVSLLTDSRDNKTYQTVQIGNQCWMKENLNYNSGSDSWCYDYDNNNCTTYGRLYFWSAAMAGASSSNSVPSGVQGVCPTGWHLPSDPEWCQMESSVETNTDVNCSSTGVYRGIATGKKLKADSPAWNGDNTSGFTALPAGYYYNGLFDLIGDYAYFWSTTAVGYSAWVRDLYTNSDGVRRDNYGQTGGYSVRCIKD